MVSAAAAWLTAGAMVLEHAFARTIIPLGKWPARANIPGAKATDPIAYPPACPASASASNLATHPAGQRRRLRTRPGTRAADPTTRTAAAHGHPRNPRRPRQEREPWISLI